jgi:hypothetical protein
VEETKLGDSQEEVNSKSNLEKELRSKARTFMDSTDRVATTIKYQPGQGGQVALSNQSLRFG